MEIKGIRVSVAISARDVSDEEEVRQVEPFINTIQAWAEQLVREIRADGWMGQGQEVTSEIARATRRRVDNVVYESEIVVGDPPNPRPGNRR